MLSFVGFDLAPLLDMVKSRKFPEVEVTVTAAFFPAPSKQAANLASIKVADHEAAIRIHEILNRNDTPCEVIEFILVHELLHILFRPREIEGRSVSHPPEFWEAEAHIFPARNAAWDWIITAIYSCIRIDKKREAVIVRREWRRKVCGVGYFPAITTVGVKDQSEAKPTIFL
jgi:hypothetical protein